MGWRSGDKFLGDFVFNHAVIAAKAGTNGITSAGFEVPSQG